MNALGLSARFLWHASVPWFARARRTTHVLSVGADRLEVDVYAAEGAPRGTLVVVHGMSPRAQRDPRIVAVARAFARCGFQVAVPWFAEVAAWRVVPDTVDRVGRALVALADWRRLGNPGAVGVFGASFSAGASLLAAADSRWSGAVRAVCAVGTFADPVGTIRWLVESEEADRYGRLVAYWNFMPPRWATPAVREAIAAALADDGWRRPEPALPVVLGAMGTADRARFERILAGERGRLADEIVDRARQVLGPLSLLDRAEDLRVPVALIHGARDRVIPASESTRLAERLGGLGADVRLEVTPLLGHGDAAWGPRTALAAGSLCGAFGWFFARAASPVEMEVP